MKTTISGIVFLLVLLCGCSTQAYQSNPNLFAGKRIAWGVIDITREKKGQKINNDTVCVCISQTVAETLYPYFQKAGAEIVKIPNEQRTDEMRIYKVADSLKVDYLISGTGQIHVYGSSDFMQQLNINLESVKKNVVVWTGSFSGPSVTPAGAANRIGKKIVNNK
jgi:hypothetical protein